MDTLFRLISSCNSIDCVKLFTMGNVLKNKNQSEEWNQLKNLFHLFLPKGQPCPKKPPCGGGFPTTTGTEQKVPFVAQGGPLLGPDEREAVAAWRGGRGKPNCQGSRRQRASRCPQVSPRAIPALVGNGWPSQSRWEHSEWLRKAWYPLVYSTLSFRKK